jgi:hypothetical protein
MRGNVCWKVCESFNTSGLILLKTQTQILDCDHLFPILFYQAIAYPFTSPSNVQYTWMDAYRQVRSVAGLSHLDGEAVFLSNSGVFFDVCLFHLFEFTSCYTAGYQNSS